MTQEVLIPKMKRQEKHKKLRLNIPFLNLLIIIFCVLILIASTFLNFSIKHYILPAELLSKTLSYQDFIKEINLILQIPALMLIISSIGKQLSFIVVLLYIIFGLFFIPIFALGGGVNYLAEYSFGYILAFLPAAIISGSFIQKKYSFKFMFFAAISGVLTIHIIGTLYFCLIALLKHDNFTFIAGWISSQTGNNLLYDLILSFIAILIGKYINSFLKFVLK